MATRIGVDIGGTFTDLIYFDEESGKVLVGKAPTTPGQPEKGCAAAIEQVGLKESLPRTAYFLHGTTVGLNALLERRGAIVGLLCTEGFRDVLELRRGTRKDFNMKWTPPAPLVPRHLRLGVGERIDARGKVLVELQHEDVRRALKTFREAGVTAIAVAYMNAYVDGRHEVETERVLREAGFDGAISLSHRVSGEYREYERSSTTVVDAFVRARMSEYLGRLEGGLQRDGFDGTCLITRSGGGSMTFAEAGLRPFETIMSGPVAGAEGAAELTRRLGLGDLVTADVGGTSFDTTVIVDGRPPLLYAGTITDLPLQTPWVDVRSIGAGGGSLARVDRGGLLQVGPESAGAQPGPACYCRGGTEPTVTDAALYLGMLGEGRLASGMVLDRARSEAAIRSVADKLSYDLGKTARGIITIAGTNMANAIREITIEGGLDPRRMSILAFGGAGPLMATELARALEIRRVIVPLHAGNFSAWGLLGADLLRTESQTRIMKLSPDAVGSVNEMLATLFDRLRQRSTDRQGAEGATPEVTLDLRFVGQEHTRSVGPKLNGESVAASADEIGKAFRDEYLRTFGNVLAGEIEIVSVRASLRRALPRRNETAPTTEAGAAEKTLPAFSFALGREVPFRILDRNTIPAGQVLPGPAIILEPTTTTYVDADFDITVDEAGLLHLVRQETVQ